MLLVPRDPLAPRTPDPHFAEEADAARAPAAERAVYRGWMLRTERYAAFADALARRGTTLRTSPWQYRAAHELPGWYDALRDVTPESHWTTPADADPLAALDAVCARLGHGPAVLRDWVKSMKHAWGEAAFVPDVADRAGARHVSERFLALRGDDFTGGLVLRRFEEFVSAEARTWWVDGALRLVTPHPDTADGERVEPDLDAIAPRVASVGLPLVTVDVVQRADGVWRVVELGDGQVSDRPRTTTAAELVRAIHGAAA